MKESNITPSRPNILANGSKNWDSILIIAISFIYVLDSTHIKSPIGIEIIIALFRTAKVLSRNDLIIVFIIDGFLYGGSSSINVCLSLLFNNLDNTNIYKEYEFIYESNNIKKHGIIDLMIEHDNYIDIIDYKLKNT